MSTQTFTKKVLSKIFCLTVLWIGSAHAADPYKIHAILPITGGASFVGKSQQQSLQIFQAMVNSEGGINGQPLEFVFHDDQTRPQITVQITNQILAEKPAVILAGGIAALCNSIGPVLKDGPFDYCLTPGVHPPAGSFQYSSSTDSHDLIQALLRYFRSRGLTKIAYLTSIDASGQDAERGFEDVLKLPENSDIRVVEHQRFNTTDVSVSAQIERIKAADPQAFIAWSTGSAIATIFKGVLQSGLNVPVATTNANQTYAQMNQTKDFLPKELYIPTALFLPHQGLFELDSKVEEQQRKFFAAFKDANLRPDAMSSMAWDPALLIVDALRKLGAKANASQVKAHLENSINLAGINGIYDFKAAPQRGLTVQNALVSRWDPVAGTWVVVSGPSGNPLPK